ncbi:ATP-binding protein [Microscilla marina]|uniref:AAA superfamily ATPase n=1 Tax=Microscilla marina ATCC 23134 TaxID=313606 RepID=A1ZVD1_MICM2|nr:ATP-binding protein [Microscilla marina]EAY25629.1 AAA superfamily ATPase [Microscilla marina ATCC 23134]
MLYSNAHLADEDHFKTLEQDLEWIASLIVARDAWFFNNDQVPYYFEDLLSDPLITLPDLVPQSSSPYATLLENMHQHTAAFFGLDSSQGAALLQVLKTAERVVLLLALLPHSRPEVLNTFKVKDAQGHYFAEFGGAWQSNACFVPTIQTALYLLAGKSLVRRQLITRIFSPQHFLYSQGILKPSVANKLDSSLELSIEYIQRLINHQPYTPQYSADFPATLLTTHKTWDELILNDIVEEVMQQARKWVKYYHQLQQSNSASRQGYRLLMSGPSGTGKTLTAALLGKEAGKPVYRIDISNIVDKYVGETSKRLAKVFDQAAAQDWILFFDEGDALFGKRSNDSGSSNERYANQEVGYLLYKLEEHQGMIFLATNHKGAIDQAFERRFDTLIEFQKPDEFTRRKLWAHYFADSPQLQLAEEVYSANWRELAQGAEVTAAWVEKFYQYCLMQVTAKGSPEISANDMRNYLTWYSHERGYFRHNCQQLFIKKFH